MVAEPYRLGMHARKQRRKTVFSPPLFLCLAELGIVDFACQLLMLNVLDAKLC